MERIAERITMERTLQEKADSARFYFRRGYAWIDALAAVGLTVRELPFFPHVTKADEDAHDEVWMFSDWSNA